MYSPFAFPPAPAFYSQPAAAFPAPAAAFPAAAAHPVLPAWPQAHLAAAAPFPAHFPLAPAPAHPALLHPTPSFYFPQPVSVSLASAPVTAIMSSTAVPAAAASPAPAAAAPAAAPGAASAAPASSSSAAVTAKSAPAAAAAPAAPSGQGKSKKALKKEAKQSAKATKKLAKATNKGPEQEKELTEEQKARKAAREARKKDKEAAEEELLVDNTPPGEKKDMSKPMLSSYRPPAVEAAWGAWWEKRGFFVADEKDQSRPTFTIVLPPPNVTGSLHLGHALTNSVQDALIRWHRMRGFNTLWIPGVDHAGIATQSVVEKMLARKDGTTRHDLGREKFVAKVWEWKQEYGDRIFSQLRRMGSSLDWSRECFTMDEPRSASVIEAFVRLHEAGLIYRDTRLVNWDCTLKTALSDIEVDYITIESRTKRKVPGYDRVVEFGVLTSFAYKLVDSDEEIVVATTRPETMLGDTAIAVHPDDKRYKHLHGKHVRHPFVDRTFPIITDAVLVDMEFGTGAVKITPAHDPNDYECGRRHKLPMINVLNDDGTLNDQCGRFSGMKRFDARWEVVKALKDEGFFRGDQDNPMRLGESSRSKDIIEPYIKPQWYVSCKGMATRAADAVRSGDLEIVPEFHKDTWFRWLDNIRDWCVSRQLWWGHRIPAYKVSIKNKTLSDKDSWVVARNEADARAQAAKLHKVKPGAITLTQDEDVLDTWFSSGLFPFSPLGWPEQTDDLKTFFPTQVLETGHDILFFWVARMVMMSLQLTDQLPFKRVLLHAMVRDAHGRKMSKSLGNVIDPIDVINGVSLEGLHQRLLAGNLDPKEVEKAKLGQKADFPKGIAECGTDALRFALCAYTSQGRDVNLDINRVVGYRQFCNKMWNATRFALANLGDDFKPKKSDALSGKERPIDLWILSRLSEAAVLSNEGLDQFNLGASTTAVYQFWYYELCDVYLEAIKPVFRADDDGVKEAVRDVLYTCLDGAIRLIHPYMPFVSEELYQRLPRRPGSNIETVMLAPYPTARDDWKNADIEADVTILQEIVHGIRSTRSDTGLVSSMRPTVFIQTSDAAHIRVVKAFLLEITALAGCGEVSHIDDATSPAPGCAANVINGNCKTHVLLKGLVDVKAEVAKLTKRRDALANQLATLEKKMAAPSYDRVPEKVRVADAERRDKFSKEISAIRESIAQQETLA